MKAIKILLLVINILIGSCTDDEETTIVEPGSYFPAYPNSWWKYLMNDKIVIIDSTSKNYILYTDRIDDSYNGLYYPDGAYVPWYYSSDYSPVGFTGPIFKYDRILVHKWFGTYLWPFMSEEIGFVFDKKRGSQYPEVIEKVTVKGKIFNGQDSVLILESKMYYNNAPIDQVKRYLEYVKNIGLVKDIRYDTITHDTLTKIILIDYQIAK
jgi:hypothetical protein